MRVCWCLVGLVVRVYSFWLLCVSFVWFCSDVGWMIWGMFAFN